MVEGFGCFLSPIEVWYLLARSRQSYFSRWLNQRAAPSDGLSRFRVIGICSILVLIPQPLGSIEGQRKSRVSTLAREGRGDASSWRVPGVFNSPGDRRLAAIYLGASAVLAKIANSRCMALAGRDSRVVNFLDRRR